LEKAFPIQYKDQNNYLGMNVQHNRDEDIITVDCKSKIEELVNQYRMAEAKPVDTPAAPGTKLYKNSSTNSTSTFPYQELLGSLLWIGRCARPDILYAINQCAQHVASFNETHVTALKRILIYLNHTKDLKMTFRRPISDKFILEAYSDADFAGEPDGNDNALKSTTGVVIKCKDGGTLFAQSVLQTVVAKSTAEAEYVSAGHCASIVAGLRSFLHELGFTQMDPTTQYEDNQACIKIAESRICSAKTRHIKVQYHYIKQLIQDKEIKMTYLPTCDMIADIMTKALNRELFIKLRDKLLNL
jgi:hypothetical protein